MKIGIRKPNLKKSLKARTTGKLKRQVKKATNPLYGKKGMGYVKNPKKAVYNKVYNRTTVGVNDILKTSNKSKSGKTKKHTEPINNSNIYEPKIKTPLDKYRKLKTWGIVLIVCGVLGIAGGGIILIIPGIILYVKGNNGERNYKLLYMLQATSKPSTPSPTPQVEPQPIKPTTPPQERKADYKITNCHVTGTSHYEDNIMRLARENSDYDYSKRDLFELGMFDEKIFKYDFPVSKFELEPEPDNPYDNKAIKVLADGEHVGYIKAGSCAHILNIIKADRIYKIEGNINGGKYKCLYDNRTDDDMIDDKFVASDLELENDSYPIHVTIEIWECKE